MNRARGEEAEREAARQVASAGHGDAFAATGRPLHGLVAIIGDRGCGKTTKLQVIPREYPETDFLVKDDMGHWRDAKNVRVMRFVSGEEIALEAMRRAPCAVILDEADQDMPNDRKISPALLEIVMRGRQARAVCRRGEEWCLRRGPVALVFGVRLPIELRTDVRKQVNFWFVGGIKDDELKAHIAKKFGRAVAERAATLPWGHFLEIDRA